jgi:acetyl esterase/lipase
MIHAIPAAQVFPMFRRVTIRAMRTYLTLAAVLLTTFAAAQAADQPAAKPPAKPVKPAPPPLPTPTHANVSYGAHARNVYDIWLAKSDKPTPLVVYIHGGGWLGGDKNTLAPNMLQFFLDHGVSVAAVNYRYSSIAPLPAPVYDAARAIQTIRSKAAEYNLDKTRVAAFGGSAGACTSMWLAFHDDLADPKSSDPIARESTRLVAAWGGAGQVSIDPTVAPAWVGEPVLDHRMISAAVGAKDGKDALARYPEFEKLYKEFSPYNHVTKDDPPVLVTYRKLDGPGKNAGESIHHSAYGVKLKEKANAVGATVILGLGDKSDPIPQEFLLKYLKP